MIHNHVDASHVTRNVAIGRHGTDSQLDNIALATIVAWYHWECLYIFADFICIVRTNTF